MSEMREDGQEQQANPAEEKARAQGWVPKEDFKGDPAKWKDAETFVKHGEDILPVLKERNEHLVKEMQGMKQDFNKFVEYAKKAEERAYQRAIADLEKRELQAVADQDVDAMQALQKERQDLFQNTPKLPEVKNEENPLMVAFKERNKWYESDPELTAEADALGAAFAQRNMAYPALLAKVEETMKALHPEKFGNSRREQHPAVEFSNDTGLPKKRNERTYENLPADAKAACEKFIQRGWVKDKEQYLANYEWE